MEARARQQRERFPKPQSKDDNKVYMGVRLWKPKLSLLFWLLFWIQSSVHKNHIIAQSSFGRDIKMSGRMNVENELVMNN